ncbi:MAG: DUF2459 domain-containing protein, partial [Cytophagaceae bacterium]
MKIAKKIISSFFIALALLLSLIAVYFIAAVALTLIPVNTSFKPSEEGVKIFVQSNGVHTDLVVPVKNEVCNWAEKIDPEDFEMDSRPFSHIAFGWGDQGFYLHTPTWGDLTFSTAINAL